MTEERIKELRELSECDLSLPRPKPSTIEAANALPECLDEIDRLRSALRTAINFWGSYEHTFTIEEFSCFEGVKRALDDKDTP